MFRRRLLMYQALMNKSDVINYPGLIAAWSAKGKTNDDKDRAILKDLTGNGHDITLNGFAFSKMSEYGGYKTNMLNWKYNHNSAVILASTSKFILYNTEDTHSHFWDYVSDSSLGVVHRPSFKLKISGLNEDEVIYYRYQDGEDFSIRHDNIELRNGINVFPEINAEVVTEKLPYTTVFEINAERILNKEITFEILPEYPDALVFDGVNDYGINEDMPILDDFTLITKIYSFNTYPSRGIITKDDGDYTKGIFSIRQGSVLVKGVSNAINFTNGITYLNLNTYNGNSINVGTGEDVSTINIGCIRHGAYFSTMAFYSAYLFDRSLDEQEIKVFIRKYIDPEYLLPSEIPTPDCYYDFSKGSNDDVNRGTIVDQSGNGNDAVAHGFAWSGMSGYGGNLYGNYKYHFDTLGTYQDIVSGTPITGNLKFKVTGLTDYFNKTTNYIELRLIRVSDGGTDFKQIKEDGEYNIELPTSKYNKIGIRSGGINIEDDTCNIDIEMLPEYPGALVFDGTDDYISLDAFDSGFSTVFITCNVTDKGRSAPIYEQRKINNNGYFSIECYANHKDVLNGKCYINNVLRNSSLNAKIPFDKKILIYCISETASNSENSTTPFIARGITSNTKSKMSVYKFLGFKEALTEEQIKAVIKKYNLLDGVDEIEVS